MVPAETFIFPALKMLHWLSGTSVSSSKSAQWHLRPLGTWSYFIYPILLLLPSNINTVPSDQSPCKSAPISIRTSMSLLPNCLSMLSSAPPFLWAFPSLSAFSTYILTYVLPPNNLMTECHIFCLTYTTWTRAVIPPICSSLRTVLSKASTGLTYICLPGALRWDFTGTYLVLYYNLITSCVYF